MPDMYIESQRVTDPYSAIAAGKLGRPEQLTAVAGPVSLATETTELSMSGGTNVTYTLADGVSGQTKTIVLTAKTGAGNALITSANFASGTTLTLDVVGEHAMLKWLAGKWRVIVATGVLA